MHLAIEKLHDRLEQFTHLKNSVKNDYLSIIQDKTIDIQARWEIFKKAPNELKVYQDSILHLHVFEQLDDNFDWGRDFDIEKYETCSVVNIVNRLETKVKLAQGKNSSKKIVKAFSKDPQLFDKLKEEILDMNVASFRYEL